MSSEEKHRRSIRLAGYDYSQGGLYFVTICAKDRKCVFGKIEHGNILLNDVGNVVKTCWLEIPDHYPNVVLHEFVIMPNHIHGMIELVGANYYSPDSTGQIIFWANNNSPLQANGTSGTIGAIVRGFKIGTTKILSKSIWQRNYHDHIIRNADAYHKILEYIITNPLKWNDDCYHPMNIKA